MFGSLSIRP